MSLPAERPDIPDIFAIRGLRMMIDADLACLYGVTTKAVNQAVKRNPERFPEDFTFRLTIAERDELVTNCDHLSRLKYASQMPAAFTQEGVAMLSGVLKSERAIQVNIEIMRVFVRLRREALAYAEISRRIDALEAKYDESFAAVFDALRALVAQPKGSERLIGLRVREKRRMYGSRTRK